MQDDEIVAVDLRDGGSRLAAGARGRWGIQDAPNGPGTAARYARPGRLAVLSPTEAVIAEDLYGHLQLLSYVNRSWQVRAISLPMGPVHAVTTADSNTVVVALAPEGPDGGDDRICGGAGADGGRSLHLGIRVDTWTT